MKDKKNYIINGKKFLINPYGDIVDEGGYIKYADEFTEEELNALPPCPGKKHALNILMLSIINGKLILRFGNI